MIRRAHVSEAQKLTDISIESKKYWKYSDEEMAVFSEELKISEEYIYKNSVWVYEYKNEIIAYYSIVHREKDVAFSAIKLKKGFWLDHMFVLPEYINRTIGRELFDHFANQCIEFGGAVVMILADPHSKGFYEKMGAVYKEEFPSSINGRTIPYLEFTLEKSMRNSFFGWFSRNTLRREILLLVTSFICFFLSINSSIDFTNQQVGNIVLFFAVILLIIAFINSLFLKNGLLKFIKFPLGLFAFLSFPLLLFVSMDIIELVKRHGKNTTLDMTNEVVVNGVTIRGYQSNGTQIRDYKMKIRKEKSIFPGLVYYEVIFNEASSENMIFEGVEDTLVLKKGDVIIRKIKIETW